LPAERDDTTEPRKSAGAVRRAAYARCVLPPIENRDPGDETAEDDS